MQTQNSSVSSENSNNPNRHVEEYLRYYCGLKNPGYAVLLKGDWGSGKTWFIKNFLPQNQDESSPSNIRRPRCLSRLWRDIKGIFLWKQNKGSLPAAKQLKSLYVSLYGKTTFFEIEEDFLRELHPVLASRGMKLVGKIVSGLIKTSIKVDLNSDGKEEFTLNSQIPGLNLSDFRIDIKERVLVFDDLERCQIDIADLLGYINFLVEHEGYRVIIIANEEEIFKKENHEENKHKAIKYAIVKEKLIGQIFDISPDFSGAFEGFLGRLKQQEGSEQEKESLQKSLEDNKPFIKPFIGLLLQEHQCNNLRILKNILYDFRRIFLALPEEAQKSSSALLSVLQNLVFFRVHIDKGILKPSEIRNLHQYSYREDADEPAKGRKGRNEEVQENDAIQTRSKMLKSHRSLSFMQPFIDNDWWQDVFSKGAIDENKLKKLFEDSPFSSKKKDNWQRFINFPDLTDDEFDQVLQSVMDDYAAFKFEDIEVVKHIVSTLLRLAKEGLYEKSEDEVLQQGRDYVDQMESIRQWNLEKRRLYDGSDAYAGFYFTKRDNPKYKDFVMYIQSKKEEAIEKNIGSDVGNLLSLMKENVSQFSINIRDASSIYVGFPILQHVDPEQFLKMVESITPEDRRQVFYSIKERYMHYANQTEELGFLRKLKELMEKRVQERQGRLSSFTFKLLIKNNLDPAIASLEAFQNQIASRKASENQATSSPD